MIVAATRAVHVGSVIVGMLVVPVIGMRVCRMIVVVVRMVVTAGAVVVGHTLGAEGAIDRGRRAALAADELGRGGRRRDVEDFGADLGRDVVAAELPGESHQAGRVLGADLEKRLRGGLHRDEAAVVEAQGVAVVEGSGLGQREVDMQPAIAVQVPVLSLTPGMVEADRVDDGVGADRGPADDRGGSRHGTLSQAMIAADGAPISETRLPRLLPRAARRAEGISRRRAPEPKQIGALNRSAAPMEASSAFRLLPRIPAEPWPCHVHFMVDKAKLGSHHHHGETPDRMHKGVTELMKKLIAAALAGTLALSVGACNTPQDRALGGAGLGALAGAAIGGAATGRAGGALAGAAIGGASGAIVGASTAPRCPYGTYRDAYGDVYCR